MNVSTGTAILVSFWREVKRHVSCIGTYATSPLTGSTGISTLAMNAFYQRAISSAMTLWQQRLGWIMSLFPKRRYTRVPVRGNVNTAAADYAAILQQAPGFDLALLGLGEDGHTASLFPGDVPPDNATALAIAVTHAPKLPARRVSMSPQCLSLSSAVWFVVSGSNKRKILEAWLAGAPLPPQAIAPHAGIDIFTDLDSEPNVTGS